MLFQIQKELIHKKNSHVLQTLERDVSQYNKLKKDYVRLSVSAQKKLTNQLKIYLLLLSDLHNDLTFSVQLIQVHSYQDIKEDSIRLILGRIFSKLSYKNKVIEYFLPLLESGKLTASDLEILYQDLFGIARHNDCERVLQYALNHYPEDLGWKIEALTYQVLLDHRYPQNKEHITGNLNYIYNRCHTANEYDRIAICYFEARDFDKGVNAYDAALKNLNSIEKEEIKLPFNSAKCRDAMDDIVIRLEQENIKPFPIAGSLLGLFRDGKFMNYDKDADLGVFVESDEEIFEIVSKLCKAPQFLAPNMLNNSKESQHWNVPIIDIEKDVGVDLFFFYRKPTQIEFGVYTTSSVVKWAFKPFELTRQTLAGKEYWLPENIEQHLVEMYGENWREPIEVWDSLLNCPNLTPDSQCGSIYYGLMRLSKALREGKTKKALNYYQTLTTKWGMSFSPEAKENIQRLLKN
jgi:tetratricopeptide (TPR) repeat protein